MGLILLKIPILWWIGGLGSSILYFVTSLDSAGSSTLPGPLNLFGRAENAEQNHHPPIMPAIAPVRSLSGLFDSYDERSSWLNPSIPIGISPKPIIAKTAMRRLSL